MASFIDGKEQLFAKSTRLLFAHVTQHHRFDLLHQLSSVCIFKHLQQLLVLRHALADLIHKVLRIFIFIRLKSLFSLLEHLGNHLPLLSHK